jgi:hypothetical protein
MSAVVEDRVGPWFHVPPEIARELVVGGVARPVDAAETKHSGAPASLVVLNTAASVVELTGGPAQAEAVAAAIARWRREVGGHPAKRYQLLATGPIGSMTHSLDDAPDETAIRRFILRALYGVA